jgi:hypothetical protein
MTDERLVFVQHMREHGEPMPYARRLLIQPPLDDSGDTDCWTYAARYVAEHPDAFYVEGICYLPPKGNRPRVAAHAWAVEDTPLGPVILEFTPGYEQAFGYRGLPLDVTTPEFARAEHDGHRYSVIELHIAAGAFLASKEK